MAGRPFRVDFVEFDGSVVLREMVDTVGLPRVDYLMVLEGVEFSLLARRAYYRSRNQLRMALDFRSPSLLFSAWCVRVASSCALQSPDRRWQRVELRSRGLWDALGGKMARRIEPMS